MNGRDEMVRMRSVAELLAFALEIVDELDSLAAVRIDEALLEVRDWLRRRDAMNG